MPAGGEDQPLHSQETPIRDFFELGASVLTADRPSIEGEDKSNMFLLSNTPSPAIVKESEFFVAPRLDSFLSPVKDDALDC